ncbi:MAG: protein-L-isoaspartate O-methyltransferase [Fimbriimonadaceae bacterium]|nr:protein-L-isoaspartate O-methyltransferase [Alphaproteobacteria bacterium]
MEARKNMVESQIHPNDVTDLGVLSAMLSVPRERFVPSSRRSVAYMDEAVSIGEDNVRPKRYLMEPMPTAKLLQLADVKKSDLVLDIGSGTGYSSTVLAKLADSVVALENDESLVEAANKVLAELEIGNVAVVCGPLTDGYPQEGPYDVIFINGAVSKVPELLFSQLKEGGRLVAVIGNGPVGVAWLYLKSDGHVGGRPAFDATIAPLPGFEAPEKFSF